MFLNSFRVGKAHWKIVRFYRYGTKQIIFGWCIYMVSDPSLFTWACLHFSIAWFMSHCLCGRGVSFYKYGFYDSFVIILILFASGSLRITWYWSATSWQHSPSQFSAPLDITWWEYTCTWYPHRQMKSSSSHVLILLLFSKKVNQPVKIKNK